MLPARPRKPRDKAKVEAAVQHVERWVMVPLRHQAFFSLGELRGAIAPLVAALNERAFQKTEHAPAGSFPTARSGPECTMRVRGLNGA